MMTLADTTQPLQVGTILVTLLGGLALFLYGMDQMANALKVVAGERMKAVLARLTTNRFTGVFAGAFVTSIIQSSSVTTVLVVGFISAGLMTLPQSIGVILGADIGTTITTQIVAFKVTKYALALVSIGFVLLFCFKSRKIRHYGHMIMGLGLIFFGMQLMSDGTYPLRDHQPFIDMMRRMDNPLLAILLAAVFTAVIQSSSATMGVVIVLASQGLITLEAGIALALGANIGTCVTAVLASIGKPRDAVRAAVLHVIFKVVGALIWLPFIGHLAWMATSISPTHAEVSGVARLAAETPRQIANAHTIFNVVNMLIFIWFTGPLVLLMRWLVPDRVETPHIFARPKFLTPILLQTPSAAMDAARKELGRLGARAVRMVHTALDTAVSGNEDDLLRMEQADNEVDQLHGEIVSYLGKLSGESLSAEQSDYLQELLAAANYIENVGDVIETNFVVVGRNRLRAGVRISDDTRAVLAAFHRKVCWSVDEAINALVEDDHERAMRVMDAKDEINQLTSAAEMHLARRLGADAPNRLAAFRLESEMIEYLKRMYYFAKRIAKIVSADHAGAGDAGETSSTSDA